MNLSTFIAQYCALVCYYHQKAPLIPYYTVNTWNSVVNPSVYPHNTLRKIQVTICNHQADTPLYVWPDV